MPNWSSLIKGSSWRDLTFISFLSHSLILKKSLDSLPTHYFYFIRLTILPALKTIYEISRLQHGVRIGPLSENKME